MIKFLYTEGELLEIFQRFSLQWPHPVSGLKYTNSYTLLVAVVLSAKATDLCVNKATKQLFEIADTPKKMLELGEEKLGEYIRTIGLWRNKAKNIIALSLALLTTGNNQLPKTREALMTLPGVGRKTANIVLNILFNQPTIAVDTHIFRISNRLKLAPGRNPKTVEEKLLKCIPSSYLRHAHHWLVLHGRHTCKARNPVCTNCIIADLCKAITKKSDIPVKIHTKSTT